MVIKMSRVSDRYGKLSVYVKYQITRYVRKCHFEDRAALSELGKRAVYTELLNVVLMHETFL
jgi:hypothetical protein